MFACAILVQVLALGVASPLNAGAPSLVRDALPRRVLCYDVFNPDTRVFSQECRPYDELAARRLLGRSEGAPVMSERMIVEQPSKTDTEQPPMNLLNSLASRLTKVTVNNSPYKEFDPYANIPDPYPYRGEITPNSQARAAPKHLDVGELVGGILGGHHGGYHHGGYDHHDHHGGYHEHHGGFHNGYQNGYHDGFHQGGYHGGFHGGNHGYGHHGGYYSGGYYRAAEPMPEENRNLQPAVQPFIQPGRVPYPTARLIVRPYGGQVPVNSLNAQPVYIKATDLHEGPIIVPEAVRTIPGYPVEFGAQNTLAQSEPLEVLSRSSEDLQPAREEKEPSKEVSEPLAARKMPGGEELGDNILEENPRLATYHVKLPVEDDVLDPKTKLFPIYNIRCRLEPAKEDPAKDSTGDIRSEGDFRSAAPQDHTYYKRSSDGRRKVSADEFLERLSAINAKLKQLKD